VLGTLVRMPTAPVQPYVSENRVRRKLPFDPRVPVVVVVSLLVVAVIAPMLRSGSFVGVTFSNPSNYSFEVAVSPTPEGARTVLGNVAANDSTSVTNVFDEGSSWTFHFSTQDRVVGEIVMSRDDLIRNGWHVAVPARYAQALVGEGVVPTD
jgi:hypothetical protein